MIRFSNCLPPGMQGALNQLVVGIILRQGPTRARNLPTAAFLGQTIEAGTQHSFVDPIPRSRCHARKDLSETNRRRRLYARG